MPSTALRREIMSHVKSVVVKVGTAVLAGDQGRLDPQVVGSIARQLAVLHQRNIRVTLVTSGAVGSGVGLAGLPRRPRSVPMLQATAAIGQPALMSLYARTLTKFNLHAGQVLVTRPDFEQRARYINIYNTIDSLHRLNAIPIINENDTIAVDELDKFADNDTIAALVTNLLQADLMVILTVVDGLLDSSGALVDLVMHVDHQTRGLVRNERSVLGSGGMLSKLNAARMVTEAGETAVIAGGRQKDVLLRLLEGERVGTIFAPASRRMCGRHRWILGAARPKGQISIDAGAVQALRAGGKSLLASGVRGVSGRFDRGAIVRILDQGGQTVARGVSNYSHTELDRIKGLRTSHFAQVLGEKPFDEVVHRDNLVLTVD